MPVSVMCLSPMQKTCKPAKAAVLGELPSGAGTFTDLARITFRPSELDVFVISASWQTSTVSSVRHCHVISQRRWECIGRPEATVSMPQASWSTDCDRCDELSRLNFTVKPSTKHRESTRLPHSHVRNGRRTPVHSTTSLS